eukprot:1150272-Pelagomonas_calceolata.AAC.3
MHCSTLSLQQTFVVTRHALSARLANACILGFGSSNQTHCPLTDLATIADEGGLLVRRGASVERFAAGLWRADAQQECCCLSSEVAVPDA